MSDRVRWGIIGPGAIAHRLARAVNGLEGEAELLAVASATGGMERANAFGDQHVIPHRYDSYQALADDPDVDVVYVATPHTGHKDACLLAIEAGKAVLCEKPFAVNGAQAREIIAAARRRKVFVMEAMWSRFLPAVRQVREWLDAGTIGSVRTFQATFGFRSDLEQRSRLTDPDLGGGALLDVGCYAVHLACLVLGTEPASISSVVRMNPKWGVDEHALILLGYGDGVAAVVGSSIAMQMYNVAVVEGTDGMIELPREWFNAERVTLCRNGDCETFEHPHPGGNGFHYQVEHVCRCLREQRSESEVLPLDESQAVMDLMDRIRADWGLRYPCE
jgi:dihydrodiol dehydrogenase / D-xylose 1-dehydrogenase (NADP)